MTDYVNLEILTKPQLKIMEIVEKWVKTEKTPIPKQKIVADMKKEGIVEATTQYALLGLVKSNYLRKAIVVSNKVYFVQLRKV